MSQDNIAIRASLVRGGVEPEAAGNHRRTAGGREAVCHADDGPIRGLQEFKERQHVPFLGAFPDIRIKVEAVLAHGDQVVVRWLASRHATTGKGWASPRRIDP